MVFYLISAIVGVLVGLILTMPIALGVAGVAFAFGCFALWSTRNQEIGALLGIIVMAIVLPGCLAAVATTVLANNVIPAIDWSWLIRI